ncbi:hypothetical protein C8R43DRAFT_951033 [Mycena crocata]|nr:hypothetical protein C8R43DRAFT_951033 [Mycena crocata]
MITDSRGSLMPPHTAYPLHQMEDSEITLNNIPKSRVEDLRAMIRTPSPTPQEVNALNGNREKMSRRRKIQTAVFIAIMMTFTITISVFHEKIIDALEPATDWMRNAKGGPLIIVAILIILSFPPLAGHELVATLAGLIWSLPVACSIVAGFHSVSISTQAANVTQVGTLLGEIANYFPTSTFKYACTARCEKIEQKDLSYGLLAHVVRKGGFWVVLIVRYSAIPAHFATVVFSTVGVPFGIFIIAAFLSLPKHFLPIYLGYSMKPENSQNCATKTVNLVVLGVTIVVTLIAWWWINRAMKAARPDYIYSRRKARQAKALAAASNGHYLDLQ